MAGLWEKLRGRQQGSPASPVVQAAADQAPEQKANVRFDNVALFRSGMPLILGRDDVDSAYSRSWVAFSCIHRIATDVAGIPLHVLADPSDPDSKVPDSHPLARLIARPSPYFSQSEMVQWLFTWLPLRGEYFIRFDDPRNPREMIFWDDPLYWREDLEDHRPVRWRFQKGAQQFTGSLAEVLQVREVNPQNPWRGQSRLKAAAYAYGIETMAEVLQSDVIRRGGERVVIWEFPAGLTEDQRDQAKDQLRGRRHNDGTVSNDVVVPVGAKLMDGKFLESDLAILESQKMQPDKICAVYGLSKSLLGFEDIDKYATFQGRLKVYFTQTLIPMLRRSESGFDAFFGRYLGSQWRGFVRFDMSHVEALFEDTVERFTAANIAHAGGIPWTECNRRFRLGLDVESIPGADAVLVSSALAPVDKLIAEWDMPADEPPAPAPASNRDDSASAEKAARQALIIKRAGDTRAKVQRDMRLLRAESRYRGEHRKLISAVNSAIRSGIDASPTPQKVRETIESAFAQVPDKMTAMAAKYQGVGITEGQQAIVEMVNGKMTDAELNVWKARAPWRPEVTDHIKKRENLIKDMAEGLFADVLNSALEAVSEGAESGELISLVAERLGSAQGGAHRAATIARTEIGTAYSVARDAEIRGQGFGKHMWLTANDDVVRDGSEPGEFDHGKCHEEVRTLGENFSCGLPFPMAPGGEAGNVINCRCETIPVVE